MSASSSPPPPSASVSSLSPFTAHWRSPQARWIECHSTRAHYLQAIALWVDHSRDWFFEQLPDPAGATSSLHWVVRTVTIQTFDWSASATSSSTSSSSSSSSSSQLSAKQHSLLLLPSPEYRSRFSLRRPVRGAPILVRVWVSAVGNTSVELEHEVYTDLREYRPRRRHGGSPPPAAAAAAAAHTDTDTDTDADGLILVARARGRIVTTDKDHSRATRLSPQLSTLLRRSQCPRVMKEHFPDRRPASSTSSPHQLALLIRPSDCDSLGHVNNAVYLLLLNDAVRALSLPPIRKCHVSYDEQVLIGPHTWRAYPNSNSNNSNSNSHWVFELIRPSDAAVLTRCQVQLASGGGGGGGGDLPLHSKL